MTDTHNRFLGNRALSGDMREEHGGTMQKPGAAASWSPAGFSRCCVSLSPLRLRYKRLRPFLTISGSHP